MIKFINKRNIIIAFIALAVIICIGVGVFLIIRHQKNKNFSFQANTTAQNTPEQTDMTDHIHNYTVTLFPASCENPGYSLHSCACGDTYQTNDLPAKGHSYGEWEVILEATVEAEGEKKKTCTVCGNKIIETIPKRKAPANEMGTTETTNSSENKTSETPPKKEENVCSWACSLGSFTTILEPTTTSTGLQVAYCKDCGKEFNYEIPRLISPEKLENIDQRITIRKNVANSTVSYTYKELSIWDLRSWGVAPIMVITEGDSIDVTYFKQDGSKVEWSLEPFTGYHKTMIIYEDGSYRITLFGDFND